MQFQPLALSLSLPRRLCRKHRVFTRQPARIVVIRNIILAATVRFYQRWKKYGEGARRAKKERHFLTSTSEEKNSLVQSLITSLPGIRHAKLL